MAGGFMGTGKRSSAVTVGTSSSIVAHISQLDLKKINNYLDNSSSGFEEETAILNNLKSIIKNAEIYEGYGTAVIKGTEQDLELFTLIGDDYLKSRLARAIKEGKEHKIYILERETYGNSIASDYEDSDYYIREKELVKMAKKELEDNNQEYTRKDLQSIVSYAKSFLYQWGPETEEDLEMARLRKEREEFYRDGLYEMRDDIRTGYDNNLLEEVEEEYGVDPTDVDLIQSFKDFGIVKRRNASEKSNSVETGDLKVTFNEPPTAEDINEMTNIIEKRYDSFRVGPIHGKNDISYYFRKLSDRSVPLHIISGIFPNEPLIERVNEDYGIGYSWDEWREALSGYSIRELTPNNFDPEYDNVDYDLMDLGNAHEGDICIEGFWFKNKGADRIIKKLKSLPNFKGDVSGEESLFMIFGRQ
jgi:hypothetical protein